MISCVFLSIFSPVLLLLCAPLSFEELIDHGMAQPPIPCVSCHPEAVQSTQLPFMRPAQCSPCHPAPSLNQLKHSSPQEQSFKVKTHPQEPKSQEPKPQQLPPSSHPPHSHPPSLQRPQALSSISSSQQRLTHKRLGLLFNHRDHLSLNLKCASCHLLDPSNAQSSLQFSAGVTCTTCHRKEEVSYECHLCHEEISNGRLRTRWGTSSTPQSKLTPQSMLTPKTAHGGPPHLQGFVRDHGASALTSPDTCARCHAPQECDKCHSSGRRILSIHPPHYVQQHGFELQGSTTTQSCTSCHEPTRSCAPCHQRSGLHTHAKKLSFSKLAPLRAQFHPPNYRGFAHAREATRDLSQCVSCHNERDCVRCHGANPSQRKVSPHQGRAPCSSPARVSDLSCQVCHNGRGFTSLCGSR